MPIDKGFKIGDKVKVVAHHFNGINRPNCTGEIVGRMKDFYLIEIKKGLRMIVHSKYLKLQHQFKNKLK